MLFALGLIVTAISFMGLCGLARIYLRLPSAAAPVFSACGVMAALCLSGILGVLFPGFILLMACGLAGFTWTYIIKKNKPDILTLGVLIAALGFCAWRFSGVYFTWADSVTQWGVVAKYLLTFSAFPDSATNVVYFQSYPLGQASFIYFCCKLLGKSEGLYLSAFFMLNVISLLPMTLFVKHNKVFGYVLIGVFAAFFVPFAVPLTSLQVDGFMGCLAVGAVSAIIYMRRDFTRAAIAGAVFATAFANVKTGGLFFSALIAVLIAYIAPDGKRRVKALLVVLFAAVLAFAAWEIHVKIAFANGFGTKHAISLGHYAASVREKWPGTIMAVAEKMLARLIKPGWYRISILGLTVLMLGASFTRARRAAVRAAAAFIGVYAAWYVMLFFMYVFSMPEVEALRLASIPRYEASVQILIMGLTVALTADCFCREKFASAAVRRAALCCAALAGCVLALCDYAQGDTRGLSSYIRKGPPPEYYAQHIRLKAKYGVEEGKRYLVFGIKEIHGDNFRRTFKYQTNYEYFPESFTVICQKNGGFFRVRYPMTGGTDSEPIADISKWLSDNLSSFDYVLALDESAEFERALSESGMETVFKAY